MNTARGALTQEKPLYEALTSGRLRGYAADVWWRYRSLTAFPGGNGPRFDFHTLPNVIGSNDQASDADDVLERHLEQGTRTLVEFAAGEQITCAINLDLGY
ncbi:NAD(P)-dependent oxidoreductase [Bradyrhizobium sp. sBnM-33]|uniref:NAD(P)-dependent oxidoreductase n=1 Tax=Bradyrhizobium sp. sBnM-33 TaxID=2831780 RepID=UPI0028968A5C|nr:NAD(P)-dependent oxidoreductase [Bradyrhizobium sp. sBnM-33]